MGRKKQEKPIEPEHEMPFYCKECGKCKEDKEVYDNLKVVNNTGWTHDIKCLKLDKIVYGL